MSMTKNGCTFYLPTLLAGGLVGSYLGVGLCHRQTKALCAGTPAAVRREFAASRRRRYHLTIKGLLVGLVAALLYNECVDSWRALRDGDLYAWSDFLCWLLLMPLIVYAIAPKPISVDMSGQAPSAKRLHTWFQVYRCYQVHAAKGFVVGLVFMLVALWLFGRKDKGKR